MIKVVFVDVDDTLLSFSEYVKAAMKAGFQKFGIKPYEERMYPVFERINYHLWESIEQKTLTYEELLKIRWNLIFQELGIDFDGPVFEDYFRTELFSSAIEVPYAREMLDYLKPRYVLCAASNGPYEQQMNRLRLGNMTDYFAHFFISSQVGASKPAKEFFDYCFWKLRASGFPDLKPEETMIIGDSMTSDISGGSEYGLQTCLYRTDPVRQANTEGADYVITDLREIRNIL